MYTSHNFFQKDRFPLPNFVDSRRSINMNTKLTKSTEMFLERKLKSELDNGLSSQGRLYEINIFDQPQQGL